MTKTDHLARAKDYIAKGEDYYRKAAEEIKAAMDEDPTLSYQKIGEAIGRGKTWVGDLVRWHTSGRGRDQVTPYSADAPNNERSDQAKVRRAARERPETIAAAIAKAPPEAQRKIADGLLSAPNTERSLRSIAKRSANPPPKPSLPRAEAKLGDGVFKLWEAGELLLDETPAGDERVRMTALAEKAQRLAAGIVNLLDTGELEDEFRQLVEEVGADA